MTTVSCEVWWGPGGTVPSEALSFPLNVEASNPTASAVPDRPADSNGWYNHPVRVSFEGTAYSGIASCTPDQMYAGPDTLNATVIGSCTDSAGKTAAASLTLHYDATPPTITAAGVSRPPDHHGWYNHPVTFAFTGTDATSGIDSCPTVTYAGPDSASGSVIGSCRDRAGNIARLAVRLRYQATPPSLDVAADPGDHIVGLLWRSSANLSSLEITRAPGLHHAAASVLYRGLAGGYSDARVRDGVRYRYTVTARDQAGNVTVRRIMVTPGPRLVAPVFGARVSRPPLLRWTPVRGATYYNVQLYHDGKALSAWPTHASLQLTRTWRFAGRRHRLKPGRYWWYVWPGFGPRSAARYGPKVGTGTFVVQ